MKKLHDYEAESREPLPPHGSGIECPECTGVEMNWSGPLFMTLPPMRQIVCPKCDFKKVVVCRG